jgi:tetratricopeptide (TPR) repeat protein
VTPDRPWLDAAARAVADGEPVDWRGVESSAGETDRPTIDHLKLVARVVEIHRGLAPPASGPDGSTRPDTAATDGIGTWGGLVLLERIGGGAYGDVYRARDPRLDRDVALKLLRFTGEQPSAAGVIEEARLLARVRHPNVVTVHGADEWDGRIGLWTEFLPGRTLEQILRHEGPLPVEDTVRIGIALSAGLSAVHQAGLIHRDVKAQNVMREDGGRIVLMDFGTGCERAGGSEGAGRGVAGTPLYMAPELLDGCPASVASDLYALGVVLYRLVTGDYPVRGRTVAELREAHAGATRVCLRDAAPHAPASFGAAVDRLLRVDPLARGGVADLEDALAGALADLEGTASNRAAAPADVVAHLRGRRGRLMRWAVGAAALAAGLTAIALLNSRHPAPLPREPPERVHPAVSPATSPGPPGAAPATIPALPSPGLAPIAAGSGGPAALEPRSWILIGAFENRTGQRDLDGAIEVELERELAQSEWVRIVSAARVQDALRLMKRPPEEVLTAQIALEVCRRDSEIAGVVTGHLARLGQAYRVDARIVESRGGTIVAAVVEQAQSEADLPAAVRRVSAAVRKQLGESRDRIRASDETLEQVTTPSTQALRLYSQSRQAAASNKREAALLLARDAVAEDAGFASGHAWVAFLLLGQNKRDEATAAVERAAALASSTTGEERLFIDALAKDVAGRRDEATAAWETYVRLRPDDGRALDRLLEAFLSVGREEDVFRMYAKAATLRPNDYSANLDAAWYGMVYGARIKEIQPFLVRARALLSPDGGSEMAPWVQFEPVFEDWLRGDARAAVRRLDAAARSENRSEPFLYALANMNLAFGRLRAAEAALDRSPLVPSRPAWLSRAEIAITRGDVAGGRAAVGSAVPLTLPPSTAVNRLVSVLVRLGLLDEADRVLEGQPEQIKKQNAAFAAGEGDVALARGDVPRAVDRLAAWGQTVRGSASYCIAATSYAKALERRGALKEAAKVLEKLGSERIYLYARLSSPIPFWLRSRPVLARIYRALGRTAEAAAVEAEVRRLIAVADPDLVLEELGVSR